LLFSEKCASIYGDFKGVEIMPQFIFSKIFIESYYHHFNDTLNMNKTNLKYSISELEDALKDFFHGVLGYRFHNNYNLAEIKMYCDNICKNISVIGAKKTLPDLIRDYRDTFVELLESHPYVKLFLDVLKRIFGKYYDGKLGNYSHFPNGKENTEAVISHQGKSFVITKAVRPNTFTLPSIFINNIDRVEESLSKFIESVRNSDTYYNIFNNMGYMCYSDEDKIRMLFEAILLNATTFDLSNIDLFFKRYRHFVEDKVLGNIEGVNFLGNALDDELYCKVRKSDIEYETPYYLAFMLKDSHHELPNVRLSINKNDSLAYIMAVQTSQTIAENPEINEKIKASIPRTSDYRFFNPSHLISLTIAFGFINGLGIKNVNVVDYMPVRYYKTIQDKKMDEDEAHRYLVRLTDKNIYTYMKLDLLADGIEITNLPGTGYNMTLRIQDEVVFRNEFLQNLYDLGFKFGQAQSQKDDYAKTLKI